HNVGGETSLPEGSPGGGLRPVLAQGTSALRSQAMPTWQPLLRNHQGYSTKARFGFRRSKTTRDQLKEAAFEPASETAMKIDGMGRMILAGGAAVGLGALCYYGLGMSNEIGAIEKAVIWPQYVKDRIHSTYMYFAGSVGFTALSAVLVSRTPCAHGSHDEGFLAMGATFAAMIGAGMLVRSISYEQSPMPKHLAWILHVIAPMTLLGGPLMLRAAWYTAGIVGGLSTVAMSFLCAQRLEVDFEISTPMY
uniref:Growth hormone-inducible transmembrane protein n=1 Tax=Gadus morhua TaxID=8049 RepID=A0A8C4YTY3_GADMO